MRERARAARWYGWHREWVITAALAEGKSQDDDDDDDTRSRFTHGLSCFHVFVLFLYVFRWYNLSRQLVSIEKNISVYLDPEFQIVLYRFRVTTRCTEGRFVLFLVTPTPQHEIYCWVRFGGVRIGRHPGGAMVHHTHAKAFDAHHHTTHSHDHDNHHRHLGTIARTRPRDSPHCT
jgi:hypothetical protein